MNNQRNSELIASMNKLLHQLRNYVKAYPSSLDDSMPEHDIFWIEEASGNGPAKTILDAIRCHPILWTAALPEEVCVVPRSTLKHLNIPENTIDYMSALGRREIDISAAKSKYELDVELRSHSDLNTK